MAEIFGQTNGDLHIKKSSSGVSLALNMKTSTKETEDLLGQLKEETNTTEETPGNVEDDEDSFECNLQTLAGTYAHSKKLSVSKVFIFQPRRYFDFENFKQRVTLDRTSFMCLCVEGTYFSKLLIVT